MSVDFLPKRYTTERVTIAKSIIPIITLGISTRTTLPKRVERLARGARKIAAIGLRLVSAVLPNLSPAEVRARMNLFSPVARLAILHFIIKVRQYAIPQEIRQKSKSLKMSKKIMQLTGLEPARGLPNRT